MISLRGVTKRFARRLAVDALDLDVRRGEIFGLVGHNGAGKSTTIGMLLGQVFPDTGSVQIGGHDVFRERRRALGRVGAIFETPGFYDYLSGATNLRIFCEYTGRAEANRMREIIRLVGLESRIGDKVGTYSHGMRQRLALAQSLLPEPELLILDEPSEGLDPEGIHEIRNLILQLNREWRLTVLFSSHLLSEVEQLCSRIAVLRQGKLLFCGEWRRSEHWMRVAVDRQAEAQAALQTAGLLDGFDVDGRGRLKPGADVSVVTAWLVQHGYQVNAIGPVERTLEDFYLETIQTDTPESEPVEE